MVNLRFSRKNRGDETYLISDLLIFYQFRSFLQIIVITYRGILTPKTFVERSLDTRNIINHLSSFSVLDTAGVGPQNFKFRHSDNGVVFRPESPDDP